MKIWKKAFTLIELMIVVVILWVLMSTVLPKLTWAQARSRDAWRVADLWNIAAALQVYYDDNWIYPWADTTWYCLWSWTIVTDKIKTYMQSEKVPMDPQQTANSYLCWKPDTDEVWVWRYYYSSLVKDWLEWNSYVLCADVETVQKANTNAAHLVNSDASDIVATKVTDTENETIWNEDNTDTSWATYEDLIDYVWKYTWDNKLNAEPSDWTNKVANASLFCLLRP